MVKTKQKHNIGRIIRNCVAYILRHTTSQHRSSHLKVLFKICVPEKWEKLTIPMNKFLFNSAESLRPGASLESWI